MTVISLTIGYLTVAFDKSKDLNDQVSDVWIIQCVLKGVFPKNNSLTTSCKYELQIMFYRFVNIKGPPQQFSHYLIIN